MNEDSTMAEGVSYSAKALKSVGSPPMKCAHLGIKLTILANGTYA